MSLRRYPNYENSGVEWLGEVPANWTVNRLKLIADVQGGIAKGKDTGGQEMVRIPYLRVANVQDGYLDLTEIATIDIAANEVSRYLLRPGDVLMNEGGDFDKLGRGYIWQGEIVPCSHQNHVFAVRPRRVSSEWLNAITNSAYAQFYFKTRSKQSTNLASISSTNLMELPVILPPANDQEAILEFLDCETRKIDALIAEQQQLIELLKEKRHAVISHAVTKGLNPAVSLKNSGIEWLREVPAHWKLARIKTIVHSLEQGWSPQCEGYPAETAEEWGVLKVGCVNSGKFNPRENKALPGDLQPIPMLGLTCGDILISRANTRDLVGSAAIVEEDHPNLMLCDKLYRLKPDPSLSIGRFMVLYLAADGVRRRIELAATGASSSMLNIGQSVILNLEIALPPLEEQAAIVSFIVEQTTKIDALITEVETGTALLQERRTALIAAAVTGKIDVRHLPKAAREKEAAA